MRLLPVVSAADHGLPGGGDGVKASTHTEAEDHPWDGSGALAGTALHKRVLNAHAKGTTVVLAASNPLAKQAFAAQQSASDGR